MGKRGNLGIYLSAAVFAAVLAACSSVFDAKPSSGSYAEVDIVEIAPGHPSVTVTAIGAETAEATHGPFTGKFYLRPGWYHGFGTCNRPAPAGTVVKVATADAASYDFDFPIAYGKFTLDCRYGKDGQEFLITGDSLLYDENTGQSIPPALDPGTTPPPPRSRLGSSAANFQKRALTLFPL